MVALLNILFLQLFDGMIQRHGGQCNVGEGRILCSYRGHAGSIGNEDVWAGVTLVSDIEEGSFGITAHTHAVHLVDIETGKHVVVICFNILDTGNISHLRGLHDEVLDQASSLSL
ncbi:hypothetical protein GCM10011511_54580 [Puia dinghuensis]|uniref:Uncharacterized protein n=1 Tax=Puia dinghuensis TaxID=1792502 RepID=A0A8J2UIS2_9BACT|nr:hypothetical protein GCM10011511_54580 [Puia dinghuensis]